MEENKNGENSDLLGKSARLSFVIVIGCEKHNIVQRYMYSEIRGDNFKTLTRGEISNRKKS